MNAATEFDLGPLTWVKGEIDLALQRAEEALGKYEASADPTQLKFCRTHIHQVHGALAIVGLDGVTLLTESLEALLLAVEEQRLTAAEAAPASVRQALAALRQYLDELIGGEPNQPLRLLTAYRALAAARGLDEVHACELFYPDLSLRPPKRANGAEPPAPEQRPGLLKGERARYQKGLLSWLKKPEEAESGRLQMRDALQAIEALQPTAAERTFWWAALALLEALAEPAVAAEPQARQLCSRIDAQIRRQLEGSNGYAERLLREVLYYVALAPTSLNPVIAEVHAVYDLPALLPAVGDQAPQPQDGALYKLRDLLAATEEAWNKFCNGNHASLAGFVDHARLCGQLIAQVPHTDLKRLGQGFTAIANWLADDPQRFSDAVAMEVATAILLLENAQENFKRLGSDFAQQVDLMVERLHAQIAGRQLANDDIPLLDEMTRRAQERLLVGQVGREIQKNLAQVEQALDGFFRDPAKPHELGQLDAPLKQIAGALAMLGHLSAVASLRECSTRIQEFSKPGYQPHSEDFEAVANQLSLLGFFVDALANGEKDFDAFVRQMKGESAPAAAAEQAAAAPVPAAAEETAATAAAAVDFAFDEELSLDLIEPEPAPAVPPLPVSAPLPASEAIDAELLAIFLEEATEVLATIGEQQALLVADPANIEALTTVRRSTHTLKGSGRMVGLSELGEAAWELEQTYNLWLRQDQPVTPELLELVAGEHALFATWVDHLASGTGSAPDPRALVALAARLRGVEPPTVAAAAVVEEQPALAETPAPLPEAAPAGLALESLELGELSLAEEPEAAIAGELAAADEGTESPFPTELPSGEAALDEAPAEDFSLDLGEVSFAADAETTVADEAAAEMPLAALSTVDEAVAEEPAADLALDLGEVDFGEAATAELAEAPIEMLPEPLPASSDAAEAPATDLALELGEVGFGEAAAAAFAETPIAMPPEPVPVSGDALEALAEAPVEDLALDLGEVSFGDEAEAALAAAEPALADAAADEVIEALELPEFADDFPELTDVAEPAAEPDAQLQVAAEALDELLAPAAAVAEEAPAAAPTLYDIFRDEARGYLQTLVDSHAALDADPTAPTSFEMIRAAHTLGGISATVGLLPLSHLAIALEHALLRRDAAAQPASIEGLETVRQAIITLQDMFDALAQQREPEEQPPLIAALEDIFPPPPSELAVSAEIIPLPTAKAVEAPVAVPAPEPAVALPLLKDEFDEQLLPIFLEEAGDLLRDLTTQLRSWRADPAEKAAAHAIGRLLHTFKGSARMAGAMNLGELTHLLETRVEEAMHSGAATTAFIDEIENGCDMLVQTVERLRDGDLTPVAATLAPLGQPEAAAAPAAPAASVVAQVPAAEAEAEQEAGAQRATLRVRADLIDRLVNEAGELSIARTRIEGEMRGLKGSLLFLTENVIRLRNQLREIEIQAETQIQARVAQSGDGEVDFDPLELDRFTRFQELTRFMAESVNDVATVQQNLLKNLDDANAAIIAQSRLNRSLQQELMGMRMVPFASQAERLYRIVRQTAKEVGKRANLDIVGGQVDIDRSVLDKMLAPIEHMLRNAVTHGVESRDERLAAGKAEVGEIVLKLAQEGNEFILSMSDDGKGLAAERIRARAEAMGLLAPGQAADDGTLFALIFHPGFSTASELTQVSGRGIGMDVVKTEVSALGGRIEIVSQPGQGTTFRLYLPLTLAVTQTLLVRAGSHRYALPSTMIEQVLELKEKPLEAIREQGAAEWQGNSYPFHFLPHLLGDTAAAPEAHRQYWVLLLRSGSQRIALLVDELKGNQEVVVKNIGAQLARVVGIAGATVLGDGSVVLILNPVALASRAPVVVELAATQPVAVAVEPAAFEAHQPTVMVVDDSLTVRKITSRLLTREGYAVVLAKDGVDALEQLIDARPDVILSDIEMPRMDGFDFVRNVRGDAKLHTIPVIMITSRTADKHRNYALEIGANHYLGKPYDEEELLGLIAGYCKKPA